MQYLLNSDLSKFLEKKDKFFKIKYKAAAGNFFILNKNLKWGHIFSEKLIFEFFCSHNKNNDGIIGFIKFSFFK